MKVLVWHDKHGDAIYDASSRELMDDAALRILQARIEQQYLDWPDNAEDEAKTILENRDGGEAIRFLLLRSREGFEYEGMSIKETA